MSQFAFTVSDPRTGERSSGLMVARDRDGAMKMLTDRNLIVTRLSPVTGIQSSVLEWAGVGIHRLKGEQLLSLTQQIGAMLAAGMTVKNCVDAILQDSRDPSLRMLLLEMSTGLGAGNSLTEILSRYPSVFSEQYVALVATGESGGKLPDMMKRLGSLLENSLTLKKKLASALYYPAFVLIFASIMVSLLFIFGIPHFEQIYRGFGGKLPLPTQILMTFGRFIGNWWQVIGLGLVVGGIVIVRMSLTPRGQWFWDTVKLRSPIFGPLNQKLAIARFARTLGTLHSSGIPIVQSLELLARSMGNVVMEKVVIEALHNVMEGVSVTVPLRKSGWFTEMSLTMMAAGEHSGTLDQMLENVADYYETQVDLSLKGLASLLEPVIMLVVGLMVGAVIIALILPVFRLATLLFTK